MLNPNVETFLGCDASFEEASTVLFGAPFDSTTSYRPGARFGSAAIRHESYGLETYSPYQDRDMEDLSVMDSGDLELCLGNSETALEQIEERAGIILDAGKRPFLLGGEHLLVPHQHPLGLHAVVDGVGVGQGGGEGVVEGVKNVVAEIDGQGGRQKDHYKGDEGLSLLHGVLSFCAE